MTYIGALKNSAGQTNGKKRTKITSGHELQKVEVEVFVFFSNVACSGCEWNNVIACLTHKNRATLEKVCVTLEFWD